MMADLDNARLYFNIAFFIVFISLLLQGISLGLAVRLAKVGVLLTECPIALFRINIHQKNP